MATATMEAATDRPRGKLHFGYVFRGLLGLAFSAVFIAADMVNNHSGATAEMGAVPGWLGVAAALGLFIVPMVAMEEGWSQGVKSACWLCFAITAVFAVVSYFHEFDMRANARDHKRPSSSRKWRRPIVPNEQSWLPHARH